jgi:hypothetical protein
VEEWKEAIRWFFRAAKLRVKDLGLEEEILTVRGGKGDKDRFDPLAHAAWSSPARRVSSSRIAWTWVVVGFATSGPAAGAALADQPKHPIMARANGVIFITFCQIE